MEFLSRLIAGSGSASGASPTKQRTTTNTPTERLAACKRVCNTLQQLWRRGSSLSEDHQDTLYLSNGLRKLNAILHEESRRAAPHSCLLYTASSQIYIIIAKLALSAQNAEITQSSAQFFHILLRSEADGVVDSKIFARSLVDLVRRSASSSSTDEEDAVLVELLFEIATKIKLDPDILPAWFHPERDQSRARDSVQSAERARKNQFPLFYLLVDFVHHDAPTGDFARLGILYLIETASRSKPLEKWMIESDLAAQMASGLGALYSRLSRSSAWSEQGKMPAIISLSDPSSDFEQSMGDAEAERDNKAFMSYLAFWQDTLNHCTSHEVTDTLLDHFQILFVQQLLYPSLLESSDGDGGSTASVITHLFRILDALQHPELLDRLLRYLLAVPEKPPQRRPRLSVSRRKSMDQLAAMVPVIASAPILFNLLDLLVMGLKSRSSRTNTSILKLIYIMVSKHHNRVSENLPTTVTLNAHQTQVWPIDFMTQELSKLIYLASEIGSSGLSIDQAYQSLLNDVQVMLEGHACFLETDQQGKPMRQADNCKIVQELLVLLTTFFANDTIANISLTEVIISLTSCPLLSLQPWLFPTPVSDARCCLTILGAHIEQIRDWQKQFPDWDELFSSRKAELSADALNNQLDQTVPAASHALQISDTAASGPARPSGRRSESSQPSLTPSRPTTPKSRRLASDQGSGSTDDALSTSPHIPSSKTLPMIGSPLRRPLLSTELGNPATVDKSSPRTAPVLPNSTDLQTQVTLSDRHGDHEASDTSSVTEAPTSQTEHGEGAWASKRTSVSLNHILTNAVILQEFILEIAAVVQVRACLFDEVRG